MDEQTRRWLADTTKGLAFVAAAPGPPRLSRIFLWFATDFDVAGGVAAFAARHGPAEAATAKEDLGPPSAFEYFEYDWGLNVRRR